MRSGDANFFPNWAFDYMENEWHQVPLLQVTQSYSGEQFPSGQSGVYAPGSAGSVFTPGPQVRNNNGGQIWPNTVT